MSRTHTPEENIGFCFRLFLLFVPLWFQTPHVLVLAQITGCWNITSAIKTIWKMTDLLFSGWSDINKFFLQAATFLQIKSVSAASCSSLLTISSTLAVFGRLLDKKKKKKIIKIHAGKIIVISVTERMLLSPLMLILLASWEPCWTPRTQRGRRSPAAWRSS